MLPVRQPSDSRKIIALPNGSPLRSGPMPCPLVKGPARRATARGSGSNFARNAAASGSIAASRPDQRTAADLEPTAPQRSSQAPQPSYQDRGYKGRERLAPPQAAQILVEGIVGRRPARCRRSITNSPSSDIIWYSRQIARQTEPKKRRNESAFESVQ